MLPIILFVIFGSVDYYITQMQYNQLENIKNYYTNIMKVQGMLTDDDLYDLNNTLDNMGFKSISVDIVGYNDVDISNTVIYRNIEKPHEARMSLVIKAQPKFEPFIFGRLIGVKDKENEEFYFVARGDVLSEKSYYEQEHD